MGIFDRMHVFASQGGLGANMNTRYRRNGSRQYKSSACGNARGSCAPVVSRNYHCISISSLLRILSATGPVAYCRCEHAIVSKRCEMLVAPSYSAASCLESLPGFRVGFSEAYLAQAVA